MDTEDSVFEQQRLSYLWGSEENQGGTGKSGEGGQVCSGGDTVVEEGQLVL
jgi:hypothetical protein